MSSTIWTQCAGKSKRRFLSQEAWRVVEDQSKIATRKLVDSDPEQLRLEELIETVKPPLPTGPGWDHLHYLLATPFRYPPLAHGSRFRTRREAGIWYGSVTAETALAEVAFWRLRFLNDMSVDIRSEMVFTAFTIPLKSSQAVDLAAPPFSAFEDKISSNITYAYSQPLGADMRMDGVGFCRYYSARDPRRGLNVAVFSPHAFASKTVSDASRENWYCYATQTHIEFRLRQFTQDQYLQFERSDFEVKGVLPSMLA